MQRKETENTRVVKAAWVVGLATLLSRVFGFIRDVVVAGFFGAGLATDAFFVAFRIPNLLRRLFAEGSLTIAFIPVFTEYLKKRSKEEALELAGVAFTLLSIVLALVSVAGILLSPWIVMVMAPGFTDVPDKYELTVFLTRLMFPYIFFISLVALCMGILNSLRHFAAPALAPVVLNICMIASVFALRDFFAEPILSLAVGVMVGGILQLAMQFPFLLKVGARLKPNFHFGHPGVRRIGFLMLPAVFGAAVYQASILIGTILASLLPGGSVSYLYYADRVVQLPLGVFAIAVGTAALPSFSEQAAGGDYERLKGTISFSLRLILFVTIPAMVALIILRVPIISVLFQRGQFDAASTVLTAQALLYYAVGLWAFSCIRVVVSAFYALQDTRTPVKIAVVALLVNVITALLLMFPMRHSGLALATSIASAVNIIVLAVILGKRVGSFLQKDFWISVSRTTLASGVMGVSIGIAGAMLGWDSAGSFGERLLFLVVTIVVGFSVFVLSSLILGGSEVKALLRIKKG
ncbi:MAG: murein biosynthesis integral membrane protein MurJ [Deltaproteobacteria bacterium]|nr:murein biosynthesis integral membrane protein MurJ [Deltaproteobacteria bacterium]MBW2674183.1 murein biosynthesis integral membrane protein MurJ [Deltaproteobacteria bacterium]